MIAVRQLSKAYGGAHILDSIDLQLGKGSLTALVGGNGAGKSTLLKIMGGVIAATSGKVFAGLGSGRIRSIRDAIRIGVRTAHQEGSLIPAWSVGEHFPAPPDTQSPSAWAALAPHIRNDARVEDLNQVDRQAIEVARALAYSPTVLLMDEPTAGLEPDLRERIIAELRRAAENGVTVLWVTHDLRAAIDSADRILVLRAGKIVRDAPAAELSVSDLLSDFAGHVATPGLRAPHLRSAIQPLNACANLADLSLQTGQVLGIVGRHTSGISQMFRAAVGLPTRTAHPSWRPANNSSIRYMSRERASEWDFVRQDVEFNLVAGLLNRLSPFGVRKLKIERAAAQALLVEFNISAPSLHAEIEELSGGNRQKVVLARLAACKPAVLLLDEPFSGVDAPTRVMLSDKLRALASEGAAIAIYSQEIPDLIGCVDRLMAVRDDGSSTEIDDWHHAEASIESWLAGAPAQAANIQ